MKTIAKIVIGMVMLNFVGSAFAADKIQLDDRINELTVKFQSLQAAPDKCVPAELLRQAQGIVLLDRVKAGFLFAFEGGGGVALVRDATTGKWSPPAFVGANEASLGFQIGAEQGFYVVLIMNTNATRILTEPNYEYGSEARATAGPASAQAQSTVTKSQTPFLVYNDRKGLFAGASLKAGAISPADDANIIYYSQAVTMNDILFGGKVQPTPSADTLIHRLNDAAKPAQLSSNQAP